MIDRFKSGLIVCAQPMGVDSIWFGCDMEVNQLLIHNSSLTLCILSTSKTRD